MTSEWLVFLSLPTVAASAVALIIKSTLLLLLGLALHLAMRRASASARHAALSATFLAVLLSPLMSQIATPLQIAVAPATVATDTVISTSIPVVSIEASNPENTSPVKRVPGIVVEAPTFAAVPMIDALLFFYLGGLFVVLAYLAVGMLRVFFLTRNSLPLNSGHRCLSLLPQRVNNRVSLLESSEIFAPITWGFIRPVVLMPSSATNWSDQELRSALEHEFAHIQRKDWVSQIIASLVCAVHWFNPLVWVAIRRLLQEAELAADDRVLISGVHATDYATQLVELAQNNRKTHMPVVAAAMAAKGFLNRRIQSILVTEPTRRTAGNRLGNFSLGAALLATAAFVSSAQFVQAASGDVEFAVDSAAEYSTPLIRAAARGDNGEVTRLLNAGADVDKASGKRGKGGDLNRTALTTAAGAGHASVVAMLLDAGASVDFRVRGDATALIEATRNDHIEVTRLLVARGANVNKTVFGDGSPLIAATQANNVEAVRFLLAAGADPNDSVMGDESPLYHASAQGNREIIQMLLDAGVSVNKKWLGEGNALMLAIKSGEADAVDVLIAAGADPNQGVMGDGSAMIVAARLGDTNMLQKMIAAGGDVNKSFRGEGSPLIVAAKSNNLDNVKLLLNSGADIDQVVKREENALIGASWAGNLDVVDFLLNSGADPNINAPEGREPRTALRQARLSGHDNVVARLMAAGAVE